ncbi:uncharacterized protein JCM15063_006016 [Sporobolomyces koalae]|uniref:uncharacterized protein n=1 Tax=Sporobolomyces koalae TaxID=500713 RepID=UPI00316DFEC8
MAPPTKKALAARKREAAKRLKRTCAEDEDTHVNEAPVNNDDYPSDSDSDRPLTLDDLLEISYNMWYERYGQYISDSSDDDDSEDSEGSEDSEDSKDSEDSAEEQERLEAEYAKISRPRVLYKDGIFKGPTLRARQPPPKPKVVPQLPPPEIKVVPQPPPEPKIVPQPPPENKIVPRPYRQGVKYTGNSIRTKQRERKAGKEELKTSVPMMASFLQRGKEADIARRAARTAPPDAIDIRSPSPEKRAIDGRSPNLLNTAKRIKSASQE